MNTARIIFMLLMLVIGASLLMLLSPIQTPVYIHGTNITARGQCHVIGGDHLVNIKGRRYLFPEELELRLSWQNITVGAKETDQKKAQKQYYKHIDKHQVECRHRVRVGDVGDGGWDMCVAGPYKPGPNCLVYDFGIKYMWTFDDAMATNYSCTVRAFDPSMKKAEYDRSDKIHFYPVGLAGINSDTDFKIGPVRTLKNLMEAHEDESRVIDYLKIDIEFAEWNALKTILKDRILETQVKQIGIEMHSQKTGNPIRYKMYVDVLNGLQDQGFYQWETRMNPSCIYNITAKEYVSFCNEIYFLNINFLAIDK